MTKENRIEIEANREMVIESSINMIKSLGEGESLVVILTNDEGERTNVKTTVALHGSSASGMVQALEEVREKLIVTISDEDPKMAKWLKMQEELKKMFAEFDED